MLITIRFGEIELSIDEHGKESGNVAAIKYHHPAIREILITMADQVVKIQQSLKK